MSDKLQLALAAAISRILRPLARVMLNHGMAYGTFAELARKAYVEEGLEHIERSGKRPTVSAVAALTGLTRKEAKRLRENSPADNAESSMRYNRAIRVISGWVNDRRFHDENGEPATLPFDGPGASFSSLVREYSGDITPVAMLTVLESSRNVATVEAGIALMERAYIPMSTPLEKLNILGTDVGELIGTIGHNLEVEPGRRFFQRKVSNTLVNAAAVPEFRKFSNRKSQELLEEYHAWLTEHEVNASRDDPDQATYVAIGIFYTEHPQRPDPPEHSE